MLNRVSAKSLWFSMFLCILLLAQSCKQTDTIQPYILEGLSVSIVNNNLVFKVDGIFNNQDPNTYYHLAVFSMVKDDCQHDCTYWEIATDESNHNAKQQLPAFVGSITYGEQLGNMRIRTSPKRLREGKYSVGVTLIKYDKLDKSSRSFSAVEKLQLSKDLSENWNVEY